MNGVTQVPRQFKFTGTRVNRYRHYRTEADAQEKWQKLYDEAVRQEREEQKVYAQYEARLEDERRNASARQATVANLADDEEIIDQALTKCRLFVEFGIRKNASLPH